MSHCNEISVPQLFGWDEDESELSRLSNKMVWIIEPLV